ncbi:MAG: hemerythrin domain-containing protein [Nevskia sp.]|nr:hemerythrin domain-containing protein [Nevskia sp.]
MRHDIYNIPHKAHRWALFTASIAIGRLNAGDVAAADALGNRVRQLLHHLHVHMRDEDQFIMPLYAKLGSVPERLEAGHRQVEDLTRQIQAAIEDGAVRRAEADFYRLFNRLVGAYLAHTDEEETAQAELIWPNYSDEDIVAAQAEFITSRSPLSNLSDLAFILPSLNVAEICAFLFDIKRDVAEEPFGMVVAVARKTLDSKVWSAVEARLAQWH